MHSKNIERLQKHSLLKSDGSEFPIPVQVSIRKAVQFATDVSVDPSPLEPVDTVTLDVSIANVAEMLDRIKALHASISPSMDADAIRSTYNELAGALSYFVDEARNRFEAAKERVKTKNEAEEKAALRTQVDIITTDAAKSVVESHATKFKEMGDASGTAATFWSKYFNLILLLSILVVFVDARFLTEKTSPTTTTIMLLHDILPRAFLVAMLVFALSWIVKNYNAARHNEVLNLRRAAAVSTYDAFLIATAKDKGLQLEVLKQVTTAIFADKETGYLLERKQNQADPLSEKNLNEVVENAVKSALKSFKLPGT